MTGGGQQAHAKYTASYELSGDEGTLGAGKRASVKLDAETLTVEGDFADVWVLPYRQITGLHRREHRVFAQLASGEQLVLYHLGRGYEGFWRDLTSMRNELIISDSLARENLRRAGITARYRLQGDDGSAGGGCELRLYETALVILGAEEGMIRRIPFGLISSVVEEDFSVTVYTVYGEQVDIFALGRDADSFKRDLSSALGQLTQRTVDFLRQLLSDCTVMTLRRLGDLLRDGRLGSKSDIDAIDPGLWPRLESQLDEFGCREEYDFLRSISSSEQVFLGAKRGLLGDLTAEYLWFLIPICGPPGKPGNALAMEVASREGGRATYFFRIMSRDDYTEAAAEDMSRHIDSAASDISRCMLSINFRREPIYLPECRLTEPRYTRYAFAVSNLRPLRVLRDRFIGRVIHSSPQQWKEDAEDLLVFNTTVSDPRAKWRPGR